MNNLRTKIYQMIDSIEDERVLQLLVDEVSFYAGKKDIINDLNVEQLKDLDDLISKADNT